MNPNDFDTERAGYIRYRGLVGRCEEKQLRYLAFNVRMYVDEEFLDDEDPYASPYHDMFPVKANLEEIIMFEEEFDCTNPIEQLRPRGTLTFVDIVDWEGEQWASPMERHEYRLKEKMKALREKGKCDSEAKIRTCALKLAPRPAGLVRKMSSSGHRIGPVRSGVGGVEARAGSGNTGSNV